MTEDPTFPGFLDALSSGRTRGRSACRRATSPRIADAVAVHRPALVYLIPSFHNPTGLVLPAAARHDIVELARRHPDVTVHRRHGHGGAAAGRGRSAGGSSRRHRRWPRSRRGCRTW